MTTAKRCLPVCALVLAIALPSRAYDDQITHPQLTVFATQKSVLYQDGSIMFSLGLLPASKQRFLYRGRVGGTTFGTWSYDTASFVAEGAYDEDQGDNALNHFYDPVSGRGLTIPVVCGVIKTCNPSWQWMIEPADISGQNYSIPDARNFLYRGLTFNDGAPADSSNQRGQALAAMFLSLGHLQHHMEDMTQPQHVRNDVHYDKFTIPGYSTPSRYEKYTAEQFARIAPYAAAGTPVYPGASAFTVPRDFWNNTANLGVAQFTNSNFVSYGTNFSFDHGVANANRTYTQPLPGAPHDYTVGEIFGTVPPGIQSVCAFDGADCTMTMYPTAVEQKASTLSLFDQDLQPRGLKVLYVTEFGSAGYYTDKLFALNRFNFDDAHPLLIKAAVSYSAGIVNYFFRGKLQVLPPDSGPYAVVEPSATQGFSTLRFKVMNNKADPALSSGSVQAIAKFHRNGCYKPDLSGEFYLDSSGQLITPCPNYRSTEDYVRVAPAQQMSFAAGETKGMTVTFSDPIPFDATDLILQVLYRGKVGDEEGGMALGAADLSETTYLSVLNATDVFELNANGFYYYTDIIQNIASAPYSIIDLNGNHVYDPQDVQVTGGPINYQFIINNTKVGDVNVPEGRFARMAMLVDPGGYHAEIIASGAGSFDDTLYLLPANRAQYDPDRNAYTVSPFGRLRADQSNHYDSVTYWHYYPTTGTPLNKMPLSKAADATTPVAVAITQP